MLYLEIQKGEDAMNKSELQQDIGGTDDFMNITINYTWGCGQL